MNRRSFLAALAGAPALAALLAACGDDSDTGSAYSYPEIADEVVLRIGYEGGFVGPGVAFLSTPVLLVSGDGRAFTQGITTMEYPGPLLPAIDERSITKAGIEKILKLADDAGLLGEIPDYSLPEGIGIADASDTVVTITVNGTTYEHSANALGMDTPEGGSSTPPRENLNAFVTLVQDLAKVAGEANVGPVHSFAAEQYRLQAMPIDDVTAFDPAPTVVPWPGDTGIVLADSLQCALAEGTKVDELFVNANQLTFFQEGDVVYQLAVIGVLPGDAVC